MNHAYALTLANPTLPAGEPAELRFTVLGPDGAPVTAFTPSHEKDLHLIVVRTDLTGYQHVHPTRDETGGWRITLTFPEPGDYRVFADTNPAQLDHAVTLTADLTVPGAHATAPLPPAERSTTVDGYTVTLDGEPVAGEHSRLTLTVHRDGRPVTDLQPYLAAYGHLVALRAGDLAYLHVHPDGAPGDGHTAAGPDITFHAGFQTEDAYRLYLDFKHAGTVHTAEFTVHAKAGGGEAHGHGHDHQHAHTHAHH
ncbi:hypothetical protein ACFYNO_19115 [Kitasatospora sp. NPDC006697]|uniref:hypothetical protein n=1 Tax=Kitasatospora sp. NPDC006697 TaxID=3364020 RepID=UPI0036924217